LAVTKAPACVCGGVDPLGAKSTLRLTIVLPGHLGRACSYCTLIDGKVGYRDKSLLEYERINAKQEGIGMQTLRRRQVLSQTIRVLKTP
jgi:hypothetical protein